jgi:hypothetical protein
MLKKFFNRHHRIITAAIFVVACLFMLGTFDHLHPYWENGVMEDFLRDQEFDQNMNIDEDLPYRTYKRIEDSLEQVRQVDRQRVKGNGDQLKIGPLAIRGISECDTCNSLIESVREKEKYYLELLNYKLEGNTVFTISNGNYFLKYFTQDRNYPGYKLGHYDKKQVSIRYAYNEDDKNPLGSVLIPISTTTYTILNVVFIVFTFVYVILVLYIFVSALQFLYRIAIGNAFNYVNIWNLYFTGWIITGAGVGVPLIAYFISLSFKSTIPPQIHFAFWDMFLNYRPFIFAGVVVLLFASAFKRGYKLQQEQDLTI